MALARLAATALDCDDPARLGEFWSNLLDGEVVFSSDGLVAVKAPGGILTMQRVDHYSPPSWPDPGSPKQLHLDLACEDLDAAVAAAVGHGAVEAAEQPSPERWRVMTDPAGHPFCLSTMMPSDL